MIKRFTSLFFGFLFSIGAYSQTVPTPKAFFGFNIGDDYQLANYTQTEAYFKKLAASDRTKYVDIGLTEEGRHQFMLIVSSPENIKKLDHYKTIARKLALADGLTEEQAHALAAEGKAVVWIDGGLHATEVVGSHQLIQSAYELVSRTDAETMNILNNTIILFVHANPDGQELVANWYMQEKDPAKRNMSIPRLYEKYIGHDNNRDFYMMNMKESQNITRQQFLEWFPQIVYNHHQTGPAGSVVAGPPYRDPFNYVYDPLLVTSLDAVGSAMSSRLNQEGKPGYTERNGTEFSTWWNGGLRTTTYFHNMVGLLTEIIGNPTPGEVPLVPNRLIPNSNTPFPVTPQSWHFVQSIQYSVSLNYAVLNYAARQRDMLLFNMYRMGKNSIDRGSHDNWTLSPKMVDSINNAYKADGTNTTAGGEFGNAAGAVTVGGRGGSIPVKYYDKVLKDPNLRDARGYIIPADQTDFPTAVKFINALVRAGIAIDRATADFKVNGKSYPAGSYVIKCDQPFRPHILDMFEPQDHPNDFLYPGGPPIRPYDNAGWTLAYQMGVKFDRVLDGFDGPFKKLPLGQLQNPDAQILPVIAKGGYVISPEVNNAFIVVNDLLKAGAPVYRVPKGVKGIATAGPGTFYIPFSAAAKTTLSMDAGFGVKVATVNKTPKGTVRVTPARIALWDTYGGSIPSGWIRWMMEQYHYPYNVIYPQEIDNGNLKDKYDVIVFVNGAIPAPSASGRGGFGGFNRIPENLPEEFKKMTGRITAEKSIPQLKAFLEAGGNIVTIGSSANLAYQLQLPVQNALLESNGKPFSGDKFYIPGSVLQVSVDQTSPATWGLKPQTDVLFDNSPVFKLGDDAVGKGVTALATYASDKPLRSGWAWGQKYLKNTVAAFQAKVGAGNLYVFGPEITFRAQSHGTFKLLFNELYTMPKK
ncbi:M14 family metallopeptidase [Mucilaginibacter sp. RS28]|uniref:M14 family metallopeptidase n=1 Tax=Mucilaginibacter straminoryzae TaxID=2932774 RepID=A0A9X1X773_9SPHI|nr:M14 metallopeptidase family protein [Mucilaginibacter straminoryzae]MCJ8210958.1 M14 family metallopeptidase [Mucilaginibacter straminoryzae]